MESLPSAGYTGGDVYPYFKHHNPFAYMTDVLGSSAETANLVPFTQLSSDLGAGTLPNFAFIAPNAEDDAHDCPTAAQTARISTDSRQPITGSKPYRSFDQVAGAGQQRFHHRV